MNNQNDVKSFTCQAATLMGHKFVLQQQTAPYHTRALSRERKIKKTNCCHLTVMCQSSQHNLPEGGFETEQTNLKAVFIPKQHCG